MYAHAQTFPREMRFHEEARVVIVVVVVVVLVLVVVTMACPKLVLPGPLLKRNTCLANAVQQSISTLQECSTLWS